MKLGIFSIVLGTLSGCMYIAISLLTVAVRFDENGWAYGVRDWGIAWPFMVIGFTLVILGVFRLRWAKKNVRVLARAK